jgi:hypothetical protein
MHSSDVNGWRITAMAERVTGGLTRGFVSTGAAVRVNGREPVAHKFDIGGRLDTEQEAVENALSWLREWAKLEG